METPHAIVYYSAKTLSKEERAILYSDIEFRYAELQAFFQEDPVAWKGRKMEIYIYPSANEQQRLMGSRRTFVARPWTHQMHLRWEGLGDTVLAHEMAHLFTAPFASWPLYLASKGHFGFDTGLVEGIAVAADWPPQELDPHYASAALRKLKKSPDLRDIFTPTGFWSQPSGKAYTMTGSFVRWLIERHAIEKFKRLYKTGDFEQSYGKEAHELISDWENFLDNLSLTERDLAIASHRYTQRSIFEKVCARSLAEEKRMASSASRAGRYQHAKELYRNILRHEPNNPKTRYAMGQVLIDQELWLEAENWIEESLQLQLSATYRFFFTQLKGDIAWQKGDVERAKELYTDCLQYGVIDSRQRVIVAKLQGLGSVSAKQYFLERNTQAKSVYLSMEWAKDSSPLSQYLVGLRLMSIYLYEGAIPYLSLAQQVDISLEEERLFVLGKAYALNKNWKASRLIWKRLEDAQSRRLHLEAEEWNRRVDFMSRQAP